MRKFPFASAHRKFTLTMPRQVRARALRVTYSSRRRAFRLIFTALRLRNKGAWLPRQRILIQVCRRESQTIQAVLEMDSLRLSDRVLLRQCASFNAARNSR